MLGYPLRESETFVPERKRVPARSIVIAPCNPVFGETEAMERGGGGGVLEEAPERMTAKFWLLLVRLPEKETIT